MTELSTVSVRWWRAVRGEGDHKGVAFGLSDRDRDAEQRVKDWIAAHPQYHLEVWEQTYQISDETWTQIL